jgi:hypothetical protein
VFNVYVAQVILNHFTIEELTKMNQDERRENLFPLARERLLVRTPPARGKLIADEIGECSPTGGKG